MFLAVKGIALVKATSHTLKVKWTPQSAHACMLENITVTAMNPLHKETFRCTVNKEDLTNVCLIKGLTANKNYTIQAVACTNGTFGCSTPEENITVSTNPSGKNSFHAAITGTST